MCAQCDALANPDPFSDAVPELHIDVKSPIGPGLGETRQQFYAKRGLVLLAIGTICVVLGLGITMLVVGRRGYSHVVIAIGLLVTGGVQMLRGAYLLFHTSRMIPNHVPDPTFASGTSRAEHEPRHR
jgi:hypothetical protein